MVSDLLNLASILLIAPLDSVERHRMVQEQAAVQERELNNLSKRNQDLYDQYMRIDIECNRVSEELLVATGHLEQMRNECANLRAEKKIWQVRCNRTSVCLYAQSYNAERARPLRRGEPYPYR